MTVPAHPDKDIRKAITEALQTNWDFKKLGMGGHSHAWGLLTCPAKLNRPFNEWCKQIIIYGTPRNPSAIARRILSYVKKCMHQPKIL
ncbi:MAG: hypothetical protein GW760_04345 [Legionella sp.]|nr:hypothetical protein [Legionella sp.]